MPRITLVKKIKEDGMPCRKCAEVEARLRAEGYIERIDRIVVADERDPASEGMQLAARHRVELAPFFIVEDDGQEPRIYTVYLRFVKEVLKGKTSERDEAVALMEQHRGLDFL
jgi:hypothetical protein